MVNNIKMARLSAVAVCVVTVFTYLLWQYYFVNEGEYRREDFLIEHPIRFTKVSNKGTRIHVWSGPWACVWDDANAIYWEVKTDDETLHDGYWSYSWMVEGKGVADGGDCFILGRRCDTQDLIDHSNRNQLCGRSRWRLPTVQELQSLVFQEEKQGAVKINSALFTNIKRGDYWSINTKSNQAFAFNYLHNEVLELPKANAAFTMLVSE